MRADALQPAQGHQATQRCLPRLSNASHSIPPPEILPPTSTSLLRPPHALGCSTSSVLWLLRSGKLLALQHSDVPRRSERYHLLIKASKTDPFQRGATVKLSISDRGLYPTSRTGLYSPSRTGTSSFGSWLVAMVLPRSDTHLTHLGPGQPLQQQPLEFQAGRSKPWVGQATATGAIFVSQRWTPARWR